MDKVDAILAASKKGDPRQVRLLFDEDASLAAASNMFGSQPIHAAYLGRHEEVVQLLLSSGVHIDAFLACELGIIDRVRQTLETDAQFAAAFSPAGSTALHRSCYWGQVEVVRLLLERGADPNAAMRDGLCFSGKRYVRPLLGPQAGPGRFCFWLPRWLPGNY